MVSMPDDQQIDIYRFQVTFFPHSSYNNGFNDFCFPDEFARCCCHVNDEYSVVEVSPGITFLFFYPEILGWEVGNFMKSSSCRT